MTAKKRASKRVSRISKSAPSAELNERARALADSLKPAKIRAHKVSGRLRYKARAAWVDPDDAPEWTAEMFERADLYHGDKFVRRGRPPSANPKKALKLRIDADIVEHFRATGPGWQTRINDTLRRAVNRARKAWPLDVTSP